MLRAQKLECCGAETCEDCTYGDRLLPSITFNLIRSHDAAPRTVGKLVTLLRFRLRLCVAQVSEIRVEVFLRLRFVMLKISGTWRVLSRCPLHRCRSNAAAPSGAPNVPLPQTSGTVPPNIELDPATIEKLKVAEAIGEAAFEENTEILKKMMLRGLRALVIGILGFVTFSVAMKKRRRREEEEANRTSDDEDPTLRYLEEMRGLGFDVDGLEEELEAEKKQHKKS
jgi:hypothetical protein